MATKHCIIGPNVDQIRAQATRVVRGRVPSAVRKELMDAVRSGALGHLKKDGLKPEIFFHPDHAHGARERQIREASYAAGLVARALAGPEDVGAAIERAGGDVLAHALNERGDAA